MVGGREAKNKQGGKRGETEKHHIEGEGGKKRDEGQKNRGLEETRLLTGNSEKSQNPCVTTHKDIHTDKF